MSKRDEPAPETWSTRVGSFSADTETDVAGMGTPPPESAGSARYQAFGVLGRGGMGEVRLFRDQHIGRDVAIKIAHLHVQKDVAARGRFLREARIQGRLEHPAIVPVHDIQMLDDGSVSFAMKHVRGLTLAQVLAAKDAELRRRYPLRRLLLALVTVCQAMEFAHRSGVVHRDLKPANIMLGDFGEVYVLDWGLAKVLAAAGDRAPDGLNADAAPEMFVGDNESPSPGSADHGSDDNVMATEEGSMLGTPGYMSPEQLDPSRGDLTPASDIFALGAVLFEVLTHQVLVVGKTSLDRVMGTLQGVEPRPSVRFPALAIPAALEKVLVDALAMDPAKRTGSAQHIADALDAFLSGEHDLERRREMSRTHSRTAAKALERGDGGIELERSLALQELGSALVLDPNNLDARRALVEVLTSAPATESAEVRRRLAVQDAATARAGLRSRPIFLAVWLGFVPCFMAFGILDWAPFVASWFLVALAVLASWTATRRPAPPVALEIASLTLWALAFLAMARIFGTFLVAPVLMGVMAVNAQIHPNVSIARVGLGLALGGLLLIVLLEATGMIEPSFSVVDGGLLLRERALRLTHPALPWFLLACIGAAIAAGTILTRDVREQLTKAERKLHHQAWLMEQIVPAPAPSLTPETSGSRSPEATPEVRAS